MAAAFGFTAVWGASQAAPARAATVMVIEDFAPMRMVPSARAPRKAYAPLGLLMDTRRTANGGAFVEATNGEEYPFEDPAWLHYWLFPQSILAAPGETRVSLDLIVAASGGDAPPATDANAGEALPAGRRFSVAAFLADSAPLPSTWYVAAGDSADRSPWGGRGVIPAPAAGRVGTPSADSAEAVSRAGILDAARRYRLAISLSAERPIQYVRERIAAARVLIREPRCRDWEYVETEVLTLAERKRTLDARGGTVLVAIPREDLTRTESAATVLWTRLVYVADVFFADGTSETVARRLLATWPPCPEEE
jgi:hypothetical protein